MRPEPPAAPRNLTRLPDHASYATGDDAEVVLERARALLQAAGATGCGRQARRRVRPVSAERGYLREVGNLLFHLAVLVVLVGFALGSLFGYKGGVILVVGTPSPTTSTQYDDFVPGSLFDADGMDPFSFTVDDFDVDWLTDGPRAGMARGFDAHMPYRESPDAPEKDYDLQVNHPLTIGDTEVFLIGHGYAPVITVRDGDGNVATSGPALFLPMDRTFPPSAWSRRRTPSRARSGSRATSTRRSRPTATGTRLGVGNLVNPLLSLNVYTGDLNLDDGAAQSVYALDKSGTTVLTEKDGAPFRLDLRPGETVELPDGLGSVTFERSASTAAAAEIQISQTPGKGVALIGVVLALLGLMGSLFIRSRRVWVRVRREGDGTLVEMAALDRSGGGDMDAVVDELVAALQGAPADTERTDPEERS